MSCEKAGNSPGLYPVEGQKPSFDTQTRSRNEFSSLFLGVIKTSPPCRMLVVQSTFNSSSCILSRDSQDRLRSHKPENRAVSCELVGDLLTSYPSMSRYPEQPHHMPGRDFVQCLLALSDQWRRCSDGFESFQSRLTIRADTYFSGLF